MRVSADHALASLSSGGKGTHTPDGEAGNSGFDQILRHAGKNQRTHAAPAGNAKPQQPQWPTLATKIAENIAASEATVEIVGPETSAEEEVAATIDMKPKQAEKREVRPQADNLGLWPVLAPDLFRAPALANAKAVKSDTEEATEPKAKATEGNQTASPVSMSSKHEILTAVGTASHEQPKRPVASPTPPMPPMPAAADMIGDGVAMPQDASPVAPVSPKASAAKFEAKSSADGDRQPLPAAEKQSSPAVTVTAAQSFPAPAPSPSPTMTALAGAITADAGAKQVLSASAGLIQPASPVAVASHVLKIELHPAELGMVTAHMRLSGGQLSIELKPENQEAHRRLSTDADALVKSLQGLGFDVDKVTVLQPSIAVGATHRIDASGSGVNTGGRDSSSYQPGNSGGNGEPSGGQQFGRNRNNDGQAEGHRSVHPRDGAGSDLFI